MQHITGRLDPVVQKGGLHLGYHGTLDPKVHVAPVIRVLRMAAPLIGDTNTAGKARVTVDDQNLPMSAIVDPCQGVPAQRVIPLDLDSRLLHAANHCVVDFFAAHPIQHHVDPDAGAGSLDQAPRQLRSDFAGPVDVGFKSDGARAGGDRPQHRGEDLIAVLQRCDGVAGDDRRSQQCPHLAPELGVPDIVIVLELVADLLLRGVEIQ